MMVWRAAASLISLHNGLASGVAASKATYSAAVVTNRRMKTASPTAQLAIRNVLAHACEIVRVRQSLGLTGVQQRSQEAVNQLLRLPCENDVWTKRNRVKLGVFTGNELLWM